MLLLISEVESRTQGWKPRPRTQKKSESKVKDQGQKCKCFPKKKGHKNFFAVDLQKKNDLEKHFSADLQNFNHSKNSDVLGPEDLRLRGQGLKNVSSRTSLRTPPLVNIAALPLLLLFVLKRHFETQKQHGQTHIETQTFWSQR